MRSIPVAKPSLSDGEQRNINQVLQSGWLSSQGPFVKQFEKALAARYGISAVATSNGTTALHLALIALGVGPGDEVLVPSLTFISSVNVILHSRAEPVFVDVETDTWGIDPAALTRAISPKTKAIIVVHLYGHPANMSEIVAIAAKHNIKIVEDCAESQDAKIDGKFVGLIGDIGCFSFFANKIMTTGEGGACFTNNPEYEKAMALARSHGMDPTRQYWHPVVGYNYRMTSLQAAIGLAQLEKIDSFLARRDAIRGWYERELASLFSAGLITGMPRQRWAKPVCWHYSILVPAARRNEMMAYLQAQSIESRPFFVPVHKQPAYRQYNSLRLPTTESLSERGINLPTYTTLTEEDVVYICDHIKRYFG